MAVTVSVTIASVTAAGHSAGCATDEATGRPTSACHRIGGTADRPLSNRPRPNPFRRAISALRRSARATRTSGCLSGSFFICGASTNGLDRNAPDPGLPRPRHHLKWSGASLLAAMGIFDFIGTTALRMACPTASTTASCWPGITGCVGLSLIALPFTFQYSYLRPIPVRHLLRSGLDRNRPPHRPAHGPDLRRAGCCRLFRMDRRPLTNSVQPSQPGSAGYPALDHRRLSQRLHVRRRAMPGRQHHGHLHQPSDATLGARTGRRRLAPGCIFCGQAP